MSIKVIRPGLLTTIQDLGRYGLQKHGVIVSGAMDPLALRTANLLVGNQENEGSLEVTMAGPTLFFEQDALIAICGASMNPKIDGTPIPGCRPVYVKAGSTLDIRGATSGCRAYVAVAGGFEIPSVMGSQSTYLRAGIGGFQGRALKEGDVLQLRTPAADATRLVAKLAGGERVAPFTATDWSLSSAVLPAYDKNPVIRVMRGGQFDLFDAESRSRFFAGEFKVTPQSDRMGYRLSGPKLHLSSPLEMISEAVAAGTIQVPPDGNPIILLADRQTTGGYSKIGQVITVDLPIIAQVKPGEQVRFQEVTLEEAQELYRLREMEIQLLKQAIALKS